MGAITIRNDAAQDLEVERPPFWDAVAGITLPVTIADGDLDVPGLLRVGRQLTDRIPGARWADLPGTAHLPYLEDPRAFADLVLAAVS